MNYPERELSPQEIEKIVAETAQIRIETSLAVRKVEAEIALLTAQKLSEETSAAKTAIDVRYGIAVAETQEQNVRMGRKQEQEIDASDRYHHIYRFTEEISPQSTRLCMERLAYWDRTYPGCDIEISFSSSGGGVIEGLALFDYILYIRSLGHRVTTSALGVAASMAGILLQAGDVRVMHKEAWVAIHEISFGATGTPGQVEDTTEWIKKIQNRTVKIFVDRSVGAKEAGTAKTALTAAYVKSHWSRKDWWLSSDECLSLGIVDIVR